MHPQIQWKLARITRAKLHILCSKSKEVMKVKRALSDGWKHVHLSISGAKLDVVIWSRNEQIWLPILFAEISISTCLFWFNFWHYLVTWILAIEELFMLPNLEKNGGIATIQTCKKVSVRGAKVGTPLLSAFSVLICTFLSFPVGSICCVVAWIRMLFSVIFILFCCLIYVARQCWFALFVWWVFISKLCCNPILFKRLTATPVRMNFI